MKRRNFIKGLMSLAAVPVVAKVSAKSPEIREWAGGLELADDLKSGSVKITAEGLWPGVNKWYEKAYSKKTLEQALKDIEAIKQNKGLKLSIKPKYLRFYI